MQEVFFDQDFIHFTHGPLHHELGTGFSASKEVGLVLVLFATVWAYLAHHLGSLVSFLSSVQSPK